MPSTLGLFLPLTLTESLKENRMIRSIFWNLNSLTESVLVDDEQVISLAVARLLRVDDISPHLYILFLQIFQNSVQVSLCRRALFFRQSRRCWTSSSREHRWPRSQKNRCWRSCPLSERRSAQGGWKHVCTKRKSALPESADLGRCLGGSQRQRHRNRRFPRTVAPSETILIIKPARKMRGPEGPARWERWGFYWQTELPQWEGGRLFEPSAKFFLRKQL